MALLLWGCRANEGTTTRATPSATVATISDAAAPIASAITNVPMAGALPALRERAKLLLRQGQGGPSLIRCAGIVYEITIDLETSDWTHGRCEATNGPNVAVAPLVVHRGRFNKPERATIDAAYAKLRAVPHAGCPSDAGLFVLELRSTSGALDTYSCRAPLAVDSDVLVRTVLDLVTKPAP